MTKNGELMSIAGGDSGLRQSDLAHGGEAVLFAATPLSSEKSMF